MKSYIQGLITGAVLVFAIMVLLRGTIIPEEPIGRYTGIGNTAILDTKTGDVLTTFNSGSEWTGYDSMYKIKNPFSDK